MGVACSKDYSLEIKVSFPSPTNYWKMDAIVGGQVLPSVGAPVLTVAAPAYLLASGLISPNCVATFNGGIGLGFIETVPGDIYLGTLNNFTLRFWVRDAASADIFGVDWKNRRFGGGFDSQIASTGPGIIGATFTDALFNDVVAQDTYTADVNWHRIIVLCDIVGQRLSWKMDNQATISAISPQPFHFEAPPERFIFSASGSNVFSYSEIGLWQNKLLTEPQMVTDWNGGAGKTFP